MEMESWVVEKELLLDLASSISDQESRVVAGHSSKKGLSGRFSCFTFPIRPPTARMLNEWRSCDGSRLE
jgi:hypothetical protein